VQARLLPAAKRGYSILHVAIAEAPAYQVRDEFGQKTLMSVGLGTRLRGGLGISGALLGGPPEGCLPRRLACVSILLR
jgi:hypothetical protein